jgi:peptide/nickel transport system permease protein
MATTEEHTARQGNAELTLDTASLLAREEHGVSITGKSPWYLAWRRLRRNYVALAFLGIFILIVVACALAPVYAHHVAHTGPDDNHVTDTVTMGGKEVPVMALNQGGRLGVTILGPTWWHAGGRFVLGRNSLKVGIGSALICTFLSIVLALLAGYYGGWGDWLISRFFDLIWAFPVILLAIALGAALSINGLHWGPINIETGSLWIPTLVISYVLIPYVGRPLRGQILSLREKEFVEASISQGAKPLRVMFAEILPNIASSVLVFFTLIIASNILTEAALSFLGAGVQPPNPSWGTLIAEGQTRLTTAPWLTLVPGLAIVMTVLSLNIFGDGLRDALDPRAKVRIEH